MSESYPETRRTYIKKTDAWSIRFLVEPASIPITEWCAKVSWITPNLVTVVSFLITLLGAWFFLFGDWRNLAIGAVIWQFGYILDGVDGKLARKLGTSSAFGARLDNLLDKVKKALSFAALIYSSHEDWRLLVALVLLHYVLQRLPLRENPTIRAFLDRHNTLQLFDPLDAIFFVFVLGPLLGRFFDGLLVTLACQLVQIAAHLFMNAFRDKVS